MFYILVLIEFLLSIYGLFNLFWRTFIEIHHQTSLSSGEYMTFKASDMDLLIEWLFNPVYSSILFA